MALAVAEATGKGAYTLIGGGDSVAAINKYNLGDKVSYVSTGGGALLAGYRTNESHDFGGTEVRIDLENLVHDRPHGGRAVEVRL